MIRHVIPDQEFCPCLQPGQDRHQQAFTTTHFMSYPPNDKDSLADNSVELDDLEEYEPVTQIVLCDAYFDNPNIVYEDMNGSDLGRGGEESANALTAGTSEHVIRDVDVYDFAPTLLIEALFRALGPDYYYTNVWSPANRDVWFHADSLAKTYLAGLAPVGAFKTRVRGFGQLAEPDAVQPTDVLNLARNYAKWAVIAWLPHATWRRPVLAAQFMPGVTQRGMPVEDQPGESSAMAIDVDEPVAAGQAGDSDEMAIDIG